MFNIISGIPEKLDLYVNEQKLQMLKREEIDSITISILNSGLLGKKIS